MESTTPAKPSTGYTNIDSLTNGKLLQVSYNNKKKRIRRLRMPDKPKDK